jgi:hypothetical protein
VYRSLRWRGPICSLYASTFLRFDGKHTEKKNVKEKQKKSEAEKIESENREIKDVEWEKQKQEKCRIDISEMKFFY